MSDLICQKLLLSHNEILNLLKNYYEISFSKEKKLFVFLCMISFFPGMVMRLRTGTTIYCW